MSHLHTHHPSLTLPSPPTKATATAVGNNLLPDAEAWSLFQQNLHTFLGNNQMQGHREADPSPFESPLGLSSVGSPNSSRDFNSESPLLTFDDDALVNGALELDLPLFDATATVSSYGPSSAPVAPLEDYYQLYLQQQQQQQPQQQQIFTSQDNEQKFIGAHQAFNGPFAGQGTSPLDVTAMGATFAALQDIAPPTKPWELPFVNGLASGEIMTSVGGLSLSDSVYSSSQDSLVNQASPSSTPALYSEASTPLSSQASPFYDVDNLDQVTSDFVRSFARTRDTQDTSVLLRALNVAGIRVPENLLADIVPPLGAPSALSTATPVPVASPSMSEASTASPAWTFETGSKTRSSVSTGANKRAALGHKHSKSVEVTPPQGEVIFLDGKRHFRCDVCHKTFDRAFNLKTHRTIHNEEREYPFACPFERCGKKFSRKADCNRHTRTVHIKKGERLQRGKPTVVHDLG